MPPCHKSAPAELVRDHEERDGEEPHGDALHDAADRHLAASEETERGAPPEPDPDRVRVLTGFSLFAIFSDHLRAHLGQS